MYLKGAAIITVTSSFLTFNSVKEQILYVHGGATEHGKVRTAFKLM